MSIFVYTFFRSFLGLGCTLQFYGDFGGSELHFIDFYSDVHLLGDSHVQRVPWYCRFRFYRDHVLWKTAIFPRREFQCYSGWSCYHQKNIHHHWITIPHHTIPYTHPIKTQTIQLGVALKVQVRVFNCQGRQVSTSDPAKVDFSWVRVFFWGGERFSNRF